MSRGFVIAPDDLQADDVLTLLTRHREELRGHSPADACHVMSADRLRESDVTFFVARKDGELAAVGALKQLDPATGEIKSMRAAGSWRGKGAGAAILAHLIAEARQRGYREVGLETGRSPLFADAHALYVRSGFAECDEFGPYRSGDFTLCMRMALS